MTEIRRVLIPASDHSYIEVVLRSKEVVWNSKARAYSEFVGMEYLEEGDEVVVREVAE